ncbi:acetylhexosamine pyrophosphorylase-like protein 1 [Seminavis robusta]|uniref:UDP-N-acetylglucosamine diphosphorylase n=1 Tax=Seminavis robusta TaxID=568900 RepID=A0A9N8DNE4_9STRA|nr:acetylhexosamine pyrophosphorylase-like protein 1 [Seminavis robusta]|eukprot:Sro152_g069380.1 acetylhexosamine pyrophosphorylase-like protein 1 (468) ;mRNA; r:20614-22109
MKTPAEVEAHFKEHGQEHVLQFVPDLSDADKKALFDQLASVELEKIPPIAELEATLKKQEEESASQTIAPLTERVAYSSDAAMVQKVEPLGLEAIAQGQVAALVLAGGQGTRLGFDHPKGMYNIGLPSGRTLFQMIVERLLRLKHLTKADKNVPLYVMTSPINHEETVTFFESNNCFGMERADIFFFQQGVLPCFGKDNKIIMETTSKIAVAPDGNGGIYPSLSKSGALADMDKRGLKYLHVFAIDNSLVKPADPRFLGYCISEQADCGNKVCWKTNAHEKVGVVAARDGRPCVIEYSEITKEMAEQEDGNGRLVFGAGNICNHYYTLDFIKEKILPNFGNLYHLAHKKIPYYDHEKKETVTPTANNGIKLETFIFDVFPLSKRMAIWDVSRAEEFAPVKNAPGSPSDSPDTARAAISNLAKAWVEVAGGKVTGNSDQNEISPLTSFAGEGLEELVKDKEFSAPFSL